MSARLRVAVVWTVSAFLVDLAMDVFWVHVLPRGLAAAVGFLCGTALIVPVRRWWENRGVAMPRSAR